MDDHRLTWAAGAAAVALIVLLVVAVVRTSDSSHAPGFAPPPPAADSTSESGYATSSSSTSYTVPRVKTSQDAGIPVVTDGPLPTDEATVDDKTSATSTTNSNPYGTTTPTNAGHV